MALLASNIHVDLSNLTPQERLVILEVIRRDRDLRQNELDYTEKLQSDVEKLTKTSISVRTDDQCARCGEEFWCLFRHPEFCEDCGRKVCAKCRRLKIVSPQKLKLWRCILCIKERELRSLTGAWFYQSMKFRRNVTITSKRSKLTPAISGAGPTILPPVEFFLFFSFQNNNVVRRGINNGGPLPFDQPTLTDEEEDEEEDDWDSIDFIKNRNRRPGKGPRISRARFSQDYSDVTFGDVFQRNKQLLMGFKKPVSVGNAEQNPNEVKGPVKIQTITKPEPLPEPDDDNGSADEDYEQAMALMNDIANDGDAEMTDADVVPESDEKQHSARKLEVVASVYASQSDDGWTKEDKTRADAVDGRFADDETDLYPFNSNALEAHFSQWTVSESGESLEKDVNSSASIAVTGEICVEIKYSVRYSLLNVLVKECRNLVAISHRSANPYVKVYMLPDKCNVGKKKTSIKENTLVPTFEESMHYDIRTSELSGCSLSFSVWHKNRIGKNVYLGDVMVPLDERVMSSTKPIWLQLMQQGHEKWKAIAGLHNLNKSYVELSLKYVSPEPAKALLKKASRGELHVAVKQASGLMSTETGLVNSYCRLCLHSEKGSRQRWHKTSTVPHTSNPVWNKTFTFYDVTLNDLRSCRILEIGVWNKEGLTNKSLIGKVLLCSDKLTDGVTGNTLSSGSSAILWLHMLNNPNEWSSGKVSLKQLETVTMGLTAAMNM